MIDDTYVVIAQSDYETLTSRGRRVFKKDWRIVFSEEYQILRFQRWNGKEYVDKWVERPRYDIPDYFIIEDK